MAEPFLSTSWHRIANLKPRLRPHAQIHCHRYLGETWYVLQDRANGRVHRFTPAAYSVLRQMDGSRSVDAIWRSLADELGEHAPSQNEIVRLLAQLHAADMLQLDGAPEMGELLERSRKQKFSTLIRNLKSPVSITIPLWDPNRFLTWLAAATRPVPAALWAALWLICVVPAAALAVSYWAELTDNLADRVFAAKNMLLIALVYPAVKALHELGHGYAARALGAEVHTTGVMLLVFYPVPYVDASASLAFRSKYQRALVGLAGIAVELFLASCALYLWLLAQEGLARAILFDVMLIAGVSTLLVNGNPLLRFDAYYVLSDLIEIPNLGQRANAYWGQLMQRLFGVRDPAARPTLPAERFWFLLYAPAAYVYRLIVLFGIALFIASEFFLVGVVIAVWSIIVGFVMPIGKALKQLLVGPALRRRRARAVGMTFGAAALAAVAAGVVPAPLHTVTEGVIWLPEHAIVRTGAEGFVARLLAAPGQQVEVGDPLIENRHPELAMRLKAQAARVDELEAQLAAELFADRTQAEITRNSLEAERGELERLRTKSERLVIRSGARGVFVVPKAEDLAGRYFREGQVLAYVTPPEARLVRVVVPQDDIHLVRHRLLSVEAKVSDRIGEEFSGRLIREVPAAGETLPSKALSTAGGGRFTADPRSQDGSRSLERLFQFDLELSPPPDGVKFGARVFVRFKHEWEPVAAQLYRRLRQLFLARFDA